MRGSRTPIFAIALAAALSGCGTMHWHKAGVDDAALTKDLGECRRLARQKLGILGAFGPPPAMDPRFGAPSGPTQSDLMMQEAQAAGACMRERGYELVPDKK